MKPATASITIQGNTRAGFTLIELMAAMVVMAIGLFAIIQLQLVSIRGNSYAQERSNAQEIADGVAQEIMTQSLEWVNLTPNGPNVSFGALFSPPLHTLILVNANPVPMGDQIPFAALQPLTMYRGKAIGLNDTINTAGCSSLSAADPECGQYLGKIGRIYRVHYIAQVFPLMRGAANPNPAQVQVVFIKVYVSWDSKDHGPQDHAWDSILENDFLNRHMVTATVYARQNAP
jgi:prepilin-type N-terminal cleavage/methylation domain-containing protein